MMFRRTIVVGAAIAMSAAAGPLGFATEPAWAQSAKQFPSETYEGKQFPNETYSGGPQPNVEKQFPDDRWEKKGVGINPGRFEEQGVGINPGRSEEQGVGSDPGKAKPRGPGVFTSP